ncbi:MAG: hypothetical protein WDM96_14930 [Lacunisphaera sp.]
MSRNVTELLAGGRFRPLVTLGLLVAAVFGVARQFDFVRWDDPVNVTHNPLLTEPWSWDLIAKLVNGDTALRFKPLPWLLYRGVTALCGFNPAAWHALNLLLHFGAVVMFWIVLRAVLARLRPATPEATRGFLAWLGAAAWAVHPAHVEPACWVTATPYPLMVIFLLGSYWFYVRVTDPVAAGSNRRNLRWSWVLALASYASYPVGVTYGLWLAVSDLWIFRLAPTGTRAPAAWLRWSLRPLLFLLPAVASVLVTFKSSSTTPWLYPAPATLAEVTIPVRLAMAAAMHASVWTHFFWPFGLTPNNPMLPAAMVRGPLIFSMAVFSVALVAIALGLRKKNPSFAGVVFGTGVLALPVLGFTQWPSWAVADRHVYLPHLVLTGAVVGWLAARAPVQRGAPVFVVTALAFLAGLAWLGRQQVLIWRDTDSLFAYLEAQPAFTWNPTQQAYIYQLWGAHAAEHARPDDARAKNDRARRILLEAMLTEAGQAHWTEAVELSQRLEQSFGLPPVLRRERVRWWLDLGQPAAAGADLARVRRELPDDPATAELAREWLRRTGGGKDL